MLTIDEMDLLDSYRISGICTIIVVSSEKKDAKGLIEKGYLEEVPNNDGVFKVKVI